MGIQNWDTLEINLCSYVIALFQGFENMLQAIKLQSASGNSALFIGLIKS